MPATADVRSTRARAGNGRKGEEDGDGALLADVLEALDALGKGDFTVRMSSRANGRAGQLAKAFNRVADLNARLSKDLGRVGRVVGREGRMTERLNLEGAGGSWDNCVDSVNRLIDDLVRPTNEVARVLQAVAQGDLTQKMSRTIEGQPVKGEFARIGTVVNGMVDQLGSFTDEVTRVAREVGTEGKLGGQAKVKGVSGTWKDLTDSVNELAGNLTSQVRNIAQVTTAVAKGDLSQKITVDARGEILALKNTINTMVDQLGSFADEVTRVAREVGTEGKLGGQAQVKGVVGHLAGPHRLRELHGREPHHPGAQHRPGVGRRGPGRPAQKITVDGQGRGGGPGRDHQLHDRHPAGLRRRGHHAWPGRWAPRASSAARPRCRASPARGRTSPTR